MTDLPALFEMVRGYLIDSKRYARNATVNDALAALDEIAERQHDTYHQNGHTAGVCMDECAALRKACRGEKR